MADDLLKSDNIRDLIYNDDGDSDSSENGNIDEPSCSVMEPDFLDSDNDSDTDKIVQYVVIGQWEA